MTSPTYYWLLHHGQLLEALLEPVENRIAYIEKNKPEHEIPTRLKWLQPVKDPSRIPASVLKAYTDWQKACADHWEELVALHKEEYPRCPFDYYGTKELIFS